MLSDDFIGGELLGIANEGNVGLSKKWSKSGHITGLANLDRVLSQRP
jgi:hypothetical protein